MKDTMRPPSKDKPPRNRDQILPLRKGDTLERTTREPKDRDRKAPSREEENARERTAESGVALSLLQQWP
jgi:hypothetical protein